MTYLTIYTHNFRFSVQYDWFEDNWLYEHWESLDDFEDNYNYNETFSIYTDARENGKLVFIERVEIHPFKASRVYDVQEYRIVFNMDEWEVSTTYYQENQTFLTQEECYEYALSQFPNAIGDVLKSYDVGINQMEIEVIDVQ